MDALNRPCYNEQVLKLLDDEGAFLVMARRVSWPNTHDVSIRVYPPSVCLEQKTPDR